MDSQLMARRLLPKMGPGTDPDLRALVEAVLADAGLTDLDAVAEYERAVAEHADRWVPACGGREVPMTTASGRRVLYVWNPALAAHGYLDMETDMVTTEDY